MHLNSYNNMKIVKKPQKFQNAHSRLQWEHTQIFQGFITTFIVFSILTRLSLRVFILTFMKTILFWTHIVPSFANSKNLVLPRFDEIHTFWSIYPSSKTKFLTDENFCNMVIWYIIGTAMKWYTSVFLGRIRIIDISHISMP